MNQLARNCNEVVAWGKEGHVTVAGCVCPICGTVNCTSFATLTWRLQNHRTIAWNVHGWRIDQMKV